MTSTDDTQDGLNAILLALGTALLGIGGVGLVFELFNRKATERALFVLASESAENLSARLSERTVDAVVADERFVKSVLTSDRRQDYLRTFVLANLDPSAEPLASRIAEQLAGGETYSNYWLEYVVTDDQPGIGTAPQRSRLRQTYTTNKKPTDTFRFMLVVFGERDARVEADNELFLWRYWLDDLEDPLEVSECFDLVSLKVNNRTVDLTKALRETEEPFNGAKLVKTISAPIDVIDAVEYKIDLELSLPPQRPGSHVYFEPTKLAHGVEFWCDSSTSQLDVVVVEALRTDNVEMLARPHRQPTMRGVRSSDWVLPSASVAFVFNAPS